jgi:ribonuclease Z
VTSIFQPRLLNGPFGDPVLFVRLAQERGALLFDCGDIGRLSPSEIMRLTDVFISHTHIDHFIGFDHLLRIVLGRDKRIRFWGPPGLIRQVGGKLAGYTWNLVEDYRLELEVAEFGGRTLRRRLFTCRDRFRQREELGREKCAGLLLETPSLTVRAVVLDHRTPCLAYALEERAHVNIHQERLDELGLAVGPWLTRLKALYLEGRHGERVEAAVVGGGVRVFAAAELMERAATVTRGRKIAYVTDLLWTGENERRVVALARGADLMCVEAAFLERDARRARETCHLTAAQAGRLAGQAAARRLEVFHFSPRYQDEPEAVVREARESFQKWGQSRKNR